MQSGLREKGMTLLELLLVLGLLIALLAMIWNMMQLYSGHYLISERKVSRAQLVRSVSQMLNDDLAAAVQDPIHSLPSSNSLGNQFIRHFGLRGDSRSLQIDVVQPNLFAKTASVEENRQAASGLGESPNPQVPELKTIFYEFVPINAREKGNEETQSTTENAEEKVDFGSKFAGSLQDESTLDSSLSPMNEFDRSMNRPLTQKYGLSRYELDFETVDDSNSDLSSNSSPNDSINESAFAGLLSDPTSDSLTNDWENDNLLNDQLLNGLNSNASQNIKPYLTAAQLAMDSEDGTVWIPEVIDCRFRYFDGQTWFDRWNSIEKNGLPIAIEVSLKLLPLDDVEILRNSAQLLMLPEFDDYNSSFETSTNEVNLESSFVGSLQSPQENRLNDNNPFVNNTEFFESSENFDPFAIETGNNAFSNANSMTQLTSDSNLLNGKANISQSLDSLISELGLSMPLVEQVISYLPTTPLAKHQVLERRKPVPLQQGYIQRQQTPGASGRRNAQTGERQYRERTLNERSIYDRTARDRQASDRVLNERQTNNRQVSTRSENNRSSNERVAGQRTSRERTAANRTVRDRLLSAVADQKETVSEPNSPLTDLSNNSTFASTGNNNSNANRSSGAEAVPLPGFMEPIEIKSESSVRGFTPTDSSAGVSGLVPDSSGRMNLPTQTSRSAQSANTASGTSQSWIRGKSN
ncbi:MAG: hypothetical protein Q4C95_07695 [Planctomycetia bacterium]|nr:hypothetical protein [Planctomycetia bacterium]